LPTEDASPKEVVRAEELNPYAVEPSRAAPVPEVPVEERLGDLTREVLGTLDWPVARTEAERCLGCGTCVACDGCLLFCPDLAVIRVPEGRGYRVLDDYCKGCGVCVTECPTGVLELVREERE
jgi:Pyruvate/2-oxoacid:ferredoxin oxidoreductase delta subunit